MEIIKYTSQWLKGEIVQGRVMVGFGILAIIAFFYFIDFQKLFHKGMLIPFIILQLVLFGYGGFQIYKRPLLLKDIEQSIKVDAKNTLKAEIEKVQNDDKVYSWLRPSWAILFFIFLSLFFIFKNEFAKGMSLGFTILFVAAFVCDSFLHIRLKTYLSQLLQTF